MTPENSNAGARAGGGGGAAAGGGAVSDAAGGAGACWAAAKLPDAANPAAIANAENQTGRRSMEADLSH